MAILLILILPVQEHGISFPFYHQFPSSMFCSFKSIVVSPPKFIPRGFFYSILKVIGFFFLPSLSDNSLLVHRKARDLCILILYAATLQNSLIRSNNFLVETLGFLY